MVRAAIALLVAAVVLILLGEGAHHYPLIEIGEVCFVGCLATTILAFLRGR
jgi:hypothetical protein